MASFVLVHGAFHGGWCWRRVAPLLQKAGHDVFTPTLTGLGERAHLLTPDVDLHTHVRDVIGVLEYEDLERVVLVGHSYSGMVITDVADRVPGRVGHLVFLDANTPLDGQRTVDVASASLMESFRQRAQDDGDGWRIPPEPGMHFGITDEDDVRWVTSKLTPHPLKSFEQPIQRRNPAAAMIARTYVYCTTKPDSDRAAAVRARAASDSARYVELPTGHDAMVTMPDAVAGILMQIT